MPQVQCSSPILLCCLPHTDFISHFILSSYGICYFSFFNRFFLLYLSHFKINDKAFSGKVCVWECLHLSDYISQRRKTSTHANVCECLLSCFSCIRLCTILWTVVHHAPLSIVFSRKEYWRGLACPPPRDVPNPGIELVSLMSPALACGFFTPCTTILNSI